MKDPNELTHEQLVKFVKDVQWALFGETDGQEQLFNPDKNWGPETLDEVCEALFDLDRNLLPDKQQVC